MSLISVLVLVTVCSLLLSAGMGVVLVRRRREDRIRNESRVALLRELAADEQDLQIRPETAMHGDGSEIFHQADTHGPWMGRAVAAAATLVVVLGAAWTWSVIAEPSPRRDQPVAAAPAPLELLSLRHAQEDNAFTVTGLVLNPRGGSRLDRVEATVLLFDRDGTMLTSGRAPLDFTALGEGDESPFVIRVPLEGRVARYRVGFRGHDGRVLGHVDRRTPDSVAQREAP